MGACSPQGHRAIEGAGALGYLSPVINTRGSRAVFAVRLMEFWSSENRCIRKPEEQRSQRTMSDGRQTSVFTCAVHGPVIVDVTGVP